MKAEEKATKLADIAEALGLSVSTVSRALSGNGRVGKATCNRVREYIESHDYRPNMVAKGLASGHSYNLCAVFPSDALTEQIPFFYECLMGICSAGIKENYATIITTDRQGRTDHLESAISAGKADGYVILRATDDDPALNLLKESGYPLVVVGTLDDKSVVQVDEDHFGVCRSFALDILNRGYKRPAFIGGDMTHTVNKSRRDGFLSAVKQAGAEGKELVLGDMKSDDDLIAALKEIKKKKSDCVFCGDDFICYRLQSLIEEKDKPFIASFYYSEILAATKTEAPKFNAKALGKKAAEQLINLINS